MNRSFMRLGLVTLAIAAGVPASAQTSTTGAFTGTVKDAKGAPVSGANVRVTSGQISRTMVTGIDGAFRLALLNPGSMDISITKAGFTTINQKVDVSINETKTLNFKMVTEAEVTVVVAATMVGVDTTTTQTGSNFSMDMIKSIPVGRNMDSIALLTPGTADNGMNDSRFGASIGGASGSESSYVVDGIGTTDSRYGGNGILLLTDFVDQVEVQTGGFKPEYSALGGIVNVVTKSGSNTFKGSTWATFDPRGIAARPKIDRYVSQPEPENRYDIGAEVSGPILQDRLFYFVGAGLTTNESPTIRTNSAGASGSSVKRNTLNLVGKLNWFINPDLQLTIFGTYNPYTFRNDRDVPDYGTANRGYRRDDSTYAYNASLDWTINPTMILSTKFGVSGNKNDDRPVDPTPHVNDYRYYTDGPGAGLGLLGPWETGGNNTGTTLSDSKNTQFKADLGIFLGTHQLKFGVSMTRSTFNQHSWTGDAPTGTTYSDDIGGEVEVIRGINLTRSDARQREGYLVRRQEAFFHAQSRSVYDAIYAQDTWEIVPGFKAAYGVRFENQALEDSNGVKYLKFGFGDCVQPRIGLIWDLNNDGQSKITANFAKYHEIFPLRYGLRYRGGRYMYYRKYYYMDPSGDGNLNVQGAPAQMTYNLATGAWTHLGPTQYGFLRDSSSGYNDPPVVEGTKPPERTEVVLGYERNLPNGWKFNISGTHRELKNPIEDMTPVNQATGHYIDLGPGSVGQALLGNPRPGIWRWTTKSNSASGANVPMTWNSDFPEGFNVYQAVTVGLSHSSENSFLSVNYTWSRLYGTYEGVVSAVNQQVDTNGTASFDVSTLVGKGLLALDRTHVIKAYGSRSFKMGPGTLNLGFNWTYQSGTPLSQLTGQYGGTPPGNWTISPVPKDWAGYGDTPVDFTFGQFGRSPAINNVDFTAEYTAMFGKKISVTPSFNIFNAFNTRYATRLSNKYADGDGNVFDDWGKPTGYQVGRNYRAGVKIRF